MSFSAKLKITLIALILLISFFLGGSVSAVSGLYGKIPPLTSVAGVNLSSQKLELAEEILAEKIDEFLKTPLKIRFEKQIYQLTPAELGLKFYPGETLQEIPLMNKNTGLIDFLSQIIKNKNFSLKYSFDRDTARNNLINAIPALQATRGHNATFAINDQGNIVIIPEKEGIEPDLAELTQNINEITQSLKPEEIILKTKKTYPTIKGNDLAAQKQPIIEKLNRNLTLSHNGEKFYFTPMDHTDFISFKERQLINLPLGDLEIPLELSDHYPDAPVNLTEKRIEIQFDKNKLMQFIQSNISQGIEVTPQNVKIFRDENNNFSFEGTARNGKGINAGLLAGQIELAVNNGINTLSIPTEELFAQVEADKEIKKLGINELIAVGYSTFYGSPANRIHNIQVGVSRFNGLLIKPDETFSFNFNLGRVDGSTGYRRELTIVGTNTIPEYGGGLCQVSSTFFRAILWGGFPIIERNPHSYTVSYYAHPYGYGLDATIYPGSSDVKFLNNTGHNILIQSYTVGEEAYFKFYGTSDGREVEMDGPYISNRRSAPPDIIIYTDELAPGETVKKDSAHAGFDATWYRTVKQKDGEVKKETIYSHYQAWPAKYLKGKESEEAPVPEPNTPNGENESVPVN